MTGSIGGLPALASETAATAAGSLRLRTGFVDVARPAFQLHAVERGNRLFALAVVSHFDKSETAGLTRIPILHKVDTADRAMRFEQGAEGVFRYSKSEITYEDILHTRNVLC